MVIKPHKITIAIITAHVNCVCVCARAFVCNLSHTRTL